MEMCNNANRRIADENCPVAKALLSDSQIHKRVLIMGKQGKHVTIDLHAIPVHSIDGTVQGATILLHDAQPEASLEEKCEALHAEVTKDPMTKVANRAEFDRIDAPSMPVHCHCFRTGFCIPHLNRAITTSADDESAIRTYSD